MTAAEETEDSMCAELIEHLGPLALMASVRDADGRIVDFRYEVVNTAFSRAVREPAGILDGASLLQLYPSHVELGLFDEYRRVVETGRPFVGELPWFDERNVRGCLVIRASKFRDGYLVQGWDFTEARLAEQLHDVVDPLPVDEQELPPVDVWCRSTTRWVPGFRIHRVEADGTVRVQRESDGMVLPEPFPRESLRLPATVLDTTHQLPRRRERSGL